MHFASLKLAIIMHVKCNARESRPVKKSWEALQVMYCHEADLLLH